MARDRYDLIVVGGGTGGRELRFRKAIIATGSPGCPGAGELVIRHDRTLIHPALRVLGAVDGAG
ncbi:MAG: hypothetical protein ACR2IP_08330 [Solirubrobacteraceae bacterium]